ncbi:recombination protein NinB [Caballeronia sp. LZ033]|uniref:recombination protein NinB n=1 Tax=Caballeronia sp. LZ033 TaxID=3038566 RepID=UPI00286059AB|nr:recombination protein NinB [Caballeronia sp. LZ033]MDR5813338.1 recombination protein NinB [Caballeronia sp. LZ033]
MSAGVARLYREFVITGPSVWRAAVEFIRENAKAFIERGAPIRMILTTEDRKRTPEQNARYWSGAVLGAIAQQVWIDSQQFSEDTWHEHLAEQFCPRVEVVLPDGRLFSRRKSTSEMTVKEFSDYVQRVEVHAASELGVEFDHF